MNPDYLRALQKRFFELVPGDITEKEYIELELLLEPYLKRNDGEAIRIKKALRRWFFQSERRRRRQGRLDGFIRFVATFLAELLSAMTRDR